MGKGQVFVPSLLFSWLIASQAQDLQHLNKSLEFSLVANKNLTGHSIVQFQLDNSSPFLPSNWKVNIKHSILNYGGIQTFHLLGVMSVPPPKPADYELFPGIGYYKFHHADKANFDEASITCLREGGHLMIINSEAESKVVVTIYARHKSAGPWAFVGFHDRIKEGEYITIFGQPLIETGFAKWNPADPNNYGGNENCGCVLPTGLIGDIGCGDKLAYFCEYDLSWSNL